MKTPQEKLEHLERNPMRKNILEERLARARAYREEGEKLIRQGNEDLAIYSAIGRRQNVMTTTAMAAIAGMSREHLYRLQRDLLEVDAGTEATA